MTTSRHCILCGYLQKDSVDVITMASCFTSSQIAETLHEKCIETGMVYPRILQDCSGLSKNSRVYTCNACTAWMRRTYTSNRDDISTQFRKKQKKNKETKSESERVMLPLDALFAYIHNPGYHKVDLRTMRRLVRAISIFPNVYACLQSPLVQRVVHAVRNMGIGSIYCGEKDDEDLNDMIIREWWIYNGKPIWFNDAVTAKNVRRVISKWADESDL